MQRFFVSILVYLPILLSLSLSQAFAGENGQPPDVNAVVNGSGNSTSDASLDVKKFEDNYTGEMVCRLEGGRDCAPFLKGQKAGTPFQTTLGSAQDEVALESTANRDAASASQMKAMAQACCSGDFQKCKMAQEAQQSYQAYLQASAAAVAGANSTAGTRSTVQTSAQTNADLMKAAAGVTASCNAYKAVCKNQYEILATEATKAPCYGATAAGVSCKATSDQMSQKFVGQANSCNSLQPQSTQALAQSAAKASGQADQNAKQLASKDASGKDGKDQTGAKDGGDNQARTEGNSSGAKPQSANGATGAGATGGTGAGANTGSGSSMNPAMLAGLAQMAMGMLQGQQQQPDPTAGLQAQSLGDCASNPALAGCATGAAAPASFNSADGAASAFQPSSKGDSGGFASLGDTSNLNPPGFAGADPSQVGKNPITTNGVAGGGGGGIPGGSGGATLGAGGGVGSGGQASLGSSASTDILHGEGSHSGYSQVAAGMNMQAGGSGGGYTYGGGGGGNDMGEGFRLADFLPGGRKDPSRHVAAINPPMQIQSKSVNIWNRISDHIQRRCAQGLLRDCGPR